MIHCLRIFLLFLFAGTVCAQDLQQELQNVPYSKTRLQEAIVGYQSLIDANSWHTFPPNLLLRPNDTSHFVPLLQENLLLTGDLALDSVSKAPVYASAIESAVKRFQARHGLTTDGVLGPNTVAALNIPLTRRLQQLHQNLARWDTSLSAAAQPYVLINLPDYTLHVVENNQDVLQMRVIIGKPELKTFPIRSELNMVVLHPYWYVPTSIAIKEIVPLLRRNPGYLAKKNMRLEKNTSIGWIRVNPWRVDWQNIDETNFNYRIVQLSGPENELGQVKFLFPNKLPQYMHDTPHKELFDYPNRAFSHGCIRLEKPVELAYYLLKKGSGFDTEKVDKLWFKDKPNHYIKLKDPLPLFIIYQTAWVDEHMQIQFRDDMYDFVTPSALSSE
ncbi:L,D-transpeptidase family protein [Pontibacter sp. MBLB2868]|uniref:L,D-transpeptidase family protein n=1 Tax=Pontibacter sp. MBLB2868 TaxID=3451555 RepID=UPI003F7516A8